MVGKCVLPTTEAGSINELLDQMERVDASWALNRFDHIVLSVPGPVLDADRAYLPNVDWDVDAKTIPYPVWLINDFSAQAYACKTEVARNARLIKQGVSCALAPVAVVGAGSGIGYSVILPSGPDACCVVPSEMCHAMFPYHGDEELRLIEFALKRHPQAYATPDILVSGRGLQVIHEFYTGRRLEPSEIVEQMDLQSDTVRMYATLYGRTCRHYVLSVMATGGLFLTGGIAIKNPFLVDNDFFRSEFVRSPVMSQVLSDVEIRLFPDEDGGLWGAAFYGLQRAAMASRK